MACLYGTITIYSSNAEIRYPSECFAVAVAWCDFKHLPTTCALFIFSLLQSPLEYQGSLFIMGRTHFYSAKCVQIQQ